MSYIPIEDHGVIGDLDTVALVGVDGAIDFMCFPHFDSPTIFASLLDHEKGGRFQLAPVLDDTHNKQLYLPDTNVLLTRFLSADGVAEVSDFMPVEEMGHAHTIVRRAKAVLGDMRFRMVCDPRFDYARAEHEVEKRENSVVFRSRGSDGTALSLSSTVPLEVKDGTAVAEFTLEKGRTAAFVLEQLKEGRESPCSRPAYVPTAFKDTVNYWRRWVGKSRYDGRWRSDVMRSALTLKLLTSHQHGSVVAAPTFGLPETVGGERNWDYRYSWIRDASFSFYALIRLGYTEEVGAFMNWIEERCKEVGSAGTLQTMYGIDGRRDLTETTLDHLEGYRKSTPVRIGNAAHKQLQLDIYGELMDAVYLYDKYGEPISYDLWTSLRPLIDWVCGNWKRKDEGIWEIRRGKHEFLYSRVLCWVALDRGIRLANKRALPAPIDEWLRARNEIYLEIMERFWDAKLGAFTQYPGSGTLDASVLVMPLLRLISPTDPRWLSTQATVQEHLVEDSLVNRYLPRGGFTDGLEGEEGTFSMCSFWFVECLSRSGDIDKARFYFEKMLGYANHLGLFAEELSPSGEHLGNFPQAFTHLALISAAFDLNRRLSEAGWTA
jgi:GH15 family glucan-1,4-alpha-glucosidase